MPDLYLYHISKEFNMSKLKKHDYLNVHLIKEFAFDWVENKVGKGEKAGSQHFLLSPLCYLRDLTTRYCMVNSLEIEL